MAHDSSMPSCLPAPGVKSFVLSVIFLSISASFVVSAVADRPLLETGTATAVTPPVVNKISEDEAITNIVEKIRSWQIDKDTRRPGLVDGERCDRLPFVTLAYAQSLDGCVAVIDSSSKQTSSNLPLSGESSLRLTHGLRSVHDAILVGGNTFAVDNPRLNIRLWPPTYGIEEQGNATAIVRQPRPVVLDTELKSLKSFALRKSDDTAVIRAHNPIICCAKDVAEDMSDATFAGVDILPCQRDPSNSGLDLGDVLKQLREQRGIQSVMVEGGASILASFANTGYVNCICITIAPKLVGGIIGVNAFAGYTSSSDGAIPRCSFDFASCTESAFIPGIGSDCTFIAKWPRSTCSRSYVSCVREVTCRALGYTMYDK